MIDQDRPSPPPSWYEQPEYKDCDECGRPIDASAEWNTCESCIEDIRAEESYDDMVDEQMAFIYHRRGY